MEQWRKISLIGILIGNGALLIDYCAISIPYIIMIPILIVAFILIITGLIIRKKNLCIGNTFPKREIKTADAELE